jgi:hypothetical protein
VPVNDREVYAYFSARSDNTPEVVALAYAGFAKAKYDWVAHIEQLYARPPTAEEIDRWIAELPASCLEGILADAIDMFDLSACAYMEAELEAAIERARDDAVVREVTANNGTLFIHRGPEYAAQDRPGRQKN